MHVRWDEGAAATPHGQLDFFAEFLAATGVHLRWVSSCPLSYRIGNAPDKRDVLGTLMLGQDDLVLVAAPRLQRRLARAAEGEPVPMLCFPPESFFGQIIRAEVLPALMRRQQVVVRCVSEFAMGLRELALAGEGVVWLPTSLIRRDLHSGALHKLSRLGDAVPMNIVAFFATQDGGRADHLRRRFLRQSDERQAMATAA